MTTHRPELHFVPEDGVLDAPAGILRDGDTWHLFYQYRPTADSLPAGDTPTPKSLP